MEKSTLKILNNLKCTLLKESDFIITGSISLIEMGLPIGRPPHDIDLYACSEPKLKEHLEILNKSYFLSKAYKGNGISPSHRLYKFLWGDKEINLGLVEKEEWEKFLEECNYWTKYGFRFTDMNYTVKAKHKLRRLKDIEDFLRMSKYFMDLATDNLPIAE